MVVTLVAVAVLTVTPAAATAQSTLAPASGDRTGQAAIYQTETVDYVESVSDSRTTYADVVTSAAAGGRGHTTTEVRNSRFGDVEPLGHDTRERLYDVISEDPGVYLTELARRTETPVSTVRYHVRVLVDAGLVERTTERGRTHLSPAGLDDALSPVRLEDGTRRAILVALDRLDRATGQELADHLGLTEATLSYHLQRLSDDGFVVREDDGRTVVNALATGAANLHATAES